MRMVMITINEEKASATARQLVDKGGFPDDIQIERGIVASTKDVPTVHRAICNSHWRVLREHVGGDRRSEHILVMEDDCMLVSRRRRRPKTKTATEVAPTATTTATVWQMIQNTLELLGERWDVLMVGHVPVLPTVLVHSNIVWSPFPMTSHCYVLRSQTAQRLVNTLPEEKHWGRPHTIEGWFKIPLFRKFAMYPSPIIQTEMPKEIASLKHMPPTIGMCAWERIMFAIMPLTMMLSALIYYNKKRHRRCHRPTSLMLLLRPSPLLRPVNRSQSVTL